MFFIRKKFSERPAWLKTLTLTSFFIVIIFGIYTINPTSLPSTSDSELLKTAQLPFKIVMALDSPYINLFRNFHETSIEKFKLQPYLQLYCMDTKVAEFLEETYGYECSYIEISEENRNVKFHITPSKEVEARESGKSTIAWKSERGLYLSRLKTYGKLVAVQNELEKDVTVYLVDIDVTLLKEPIKAWEKDCPINQYEICVQDNTHQTYNTGVYLARPTRLVRRLFKTLLKSIIDSAVDVYQDDQITFNNIVRTRSFERLKIKLISLKLYPVGEVLWNIYDFKRLPEETRLIHFNLLKGIQQKTYMMKEYNCWTVDDDGYYSSLTRKYITYNQPHNDRVAINLRNALRLGAMLNRTLILPSFPCKLDTGCTLMKHFKLDDFDSNFEYREHSFLSNPKTRLPLLSNATISANHLSGTLEASVVMTYFEPLRDMRLIVIDDIGFNIINTGGFIANHVGFEVRLREGIQNCDIKFPQISNSNCLD